MAEKCGGFCHGVGGECDYRIGKKKDDCGRISVGLTKDLLRQPRIVTIIKFIFVLPV